MTTLVELTALTKTELIDKMLEGVTETTTSLTKREDGENVLLEETTEDAYGKVVGSRKIEWSYFVSKPVKEIITTEFNPAGKEVRKSTLRHYTTGKQPTLTVVELGGEMPIPIGK